MADTYSRQGILISVIVLASVFAAFGLATLLLWMFGDWNRFAWGMTLTLKIMWGSWVIGFVATFLTHAGIAGWRFRKAHPGEGPRALMQAIAAGIKPAAWYKTPATSFTITVVLISLLGVAVLASVLLWILGEWNKAAGALGLTLKIIWGVWWVLCIATVLVRVAIFGLQRKKGSPPRRPSVDALAESDAPPNEPAEGADAPAESNAPPNEPAEENAP